MTSASPHSTTARPEDCRPHGGAAAVAGNLTRHVRDGGHVASIVPVPEGANAENRVKIDELYHRTDAETLQAVAEVASRGVLTIPIAKTFRLDQIGAAQSAVASGIQGKVVPNIERLLYHFCPAECANYFAAAGYDAW